MNDLEQHKNDCIFYITAYVVPWLTMKKSSKRAYGNLIGSRYSLVTTLADQSQSTISASAKSQK